MCLGIFKVHEEFYMLHRMSILPQIINEWHFLGGFKIFWPFSTINRKIACIMTALLALGPHLSTNHISIMQSSNMLRCG